MKISIQDLSKEFLFDCEFKKLSNRTIINYRTSLNKYMDYLSLNNIKEAYSMKKSVIQSFINSLDLKISSKNQYIRCINSFISYVNEEYETNYKKIKLLHEEHQIQYTPTDKEIIKLLKYYNDRSFLNCRNKTILTLFVNLGLRANEIIQLDRKDVDLDNGFIVIHRKGNTVQQLPLNNISKLQLHKYLTRYKIDTNILFPSNRSKLNRLHDTNLNYLIKKANVNDYITCHSLRRYACTKMLKDGIPLIYVSRFMNHKNISITSSYYANITTLDMKDYF